MSDDKIEDVIIRELERLDLEDFSILDLIQEISRLRNDRVAVERVHKMCEESLDPERFGAWDDIKNQLFSNRSSLAPQEDKP